MTDDRARRIRETRRRFRPNGGTDEDSESSDDGSEENEATEPPQTDDTDDSTDLSGAEPDPEPEESPADDGNDEPTVTDDPEPDDDPEPEDEPAPSTGEEVRMSYDESDVPAEPADGQRTAADEGAAVQGEPAQGSDESVAIPEIDADLDGEPTVDASAIATEDDTYDRTLVADEDGRGSFVDTDALARSAHRDEDTVQVLEFFLNDDRYAVEIERISAIVEMKEITRFPRGPEAIDGVTDLRGEITAILDPTSMLDVERSDASDEHYIVVLKRDEDKQKLGIRVTDVSQAVTYHESQIDETGSAMSDGGVADGGNVGDGSGVTDGATRSGGHEFVKGIIKKTEDGTTSLVAWLDVDEVVGRIE